MLESLFCSEWVHFFCSTLCICCYDIVQQPHSHLYKNEVSSLVHILQLLVSFHEVSESLSSELSLEVSEKLSESVPLGSKLYAIGINEPFHYYSQRSLLTQNQPLLGYSAYSQTYFTLATATVYLSAGSKPLL